MNVLLEKYLVKVLVEFCSCVCVGGGGGGGKCAFVGQRVCVFVHALVLVGVCVCLMVFIRLWVSVCL